MKITPRILDKITRSAISDFLREELSNILDDVAERNLCARLAMHFENHMKREHLKGYYADPEYNRKQGGEVKTIICGEHEVIQITCDLIIHSRGKIMGRDNLIAIEMAKPNKSSQEIRDDKNRLRALTKTSFNDTWSNDGRTHPEHVCGYMSGLFLMIDRRSRDASLESYREGEIYGSVERMTF